jgi:dolichol-phosphate mannosyltransferase
MDLSVIVPTYNEKSNIATLIMRIIQALEGHLLFEIWVVDDDSPDKTWAVVKDISQRDPRVHLLRRIGRRGLSSAVVEGFSAAKGNTLAVIDADLQHDETILLDMYNSSKTANLVVGSRKVQGGGIENWTPWRRFVSWCATMLTKAVLITPLRDPMSGYFLLKKEVFTRIENEINPRGFKILLEIIHRSKESRVKEIGYVFRPRVAGTSKLSTNTIIEFLYGLFELRFGTWLSIRFLKYTLVGISGVGVNLATLWLLHDKAHLGTSLSLACAIALSMVSNFILNNWYTFKDNALEKGELLRGFLFFLLICSVGALINYAITQYLVDLSIGLYLADVAGITVATVWNYVVNRNFTWALRE